MADTVTPAACPSQKAARPAPSVIEMLGPSGVGKTTLLAHFFADPAQSAPYLSRAELDAQPQPKGEAKTAPLDWPEARAWLDMVFGLLAKASDAPSRRLMALEICRKSLVARHMLADLRPTGQIVLHDELLLHRAFSVLPFSVDPLRDARIFFTHVPLPARAIICVADPAVIVHRIAGRATLPNCYKGLSATEQSELVARLVECCFIAQDILTSRGLPCEMLFLDPPVTECSAALAQLCAKPAQSPHPAFLQPA